MAFPKLRVVFYDDGEARSYVHLERSEAKRVLDILKLLPNLNDWTSAPRIAEAIDARIPAVLWTLRQLAGAERIDVKVDGKTEVLVRRPILLLRKEHSHPRSTKRKLGYLRATVFVKRPDSGKS